LFAIYFELFNAVMFFSQSISRCGPPYHSHLEMVFPGAGGAPPTPANVFPGAGRLSTPGNINFQKRQLGAGFAPVITNAIPPAPKNVFCSSEPTCSKISVSVLVYMQTMLPCVKFIAMRFISGAR
jgi:hypothetical protein